MKSFPIPPKHFNHRHFFNLFMLVFLCTLSQQSGSFADESDYIVVNKKGVVHKFVRFDTETDHFTEHVFPNWENETFDVFDRVKDPHGIAIDLGAWIGTTAIWLANNFNHVVAVEGDKTSVICLEQNLEASKCKNVTICSQPVAETTKDVIFGPRWGGLNLSISCLKEQATSPEDYIIRSTTFKQMLFENVFYNEDLESQKVSFIKCDIEGGEEEILEDVLHFAFNNKCPVYMSFHIDWWKNNSIYDFMYLFDHFETGFSSSELCEFLEKNPFASILFEPKNTGFLVKKNMTAVIIGFNLYTYISSMVKQLEKYTSDMRYCQMLCSDFMSIPYFR